jgi:hypothetical protein
MSLSLTLTLALFQFQFHIVDSDSMIPPRIRKRSQIDCEIQLPSISDFDLNLCVAAIVMIIYLTIANQIFSE